MGEAYKYNPDDFKGVTNLRDDLENFYVLLEKYDTDKSRQNRLFLEKHSRDIFFTIKHRELEGAITHADAHGLREYIRGLLSDD